MYVLGLVFLFLHEYPLDPGEIAGTRENSESQQTEYFVHFDGCKIQRSCFYLVYLIILFSESSSR